MQSPERTIIDMIKLMFAYVKAIIRFTINIFTGIHRSFYNLCLNKPTYAAYLIDGLIILVIILAILKTYTKPKASQPELNKLLKVETGFTFDKKKFHKLILWVGIAIAFLTIIVLYLGLLKV